MSTENINTQQTTPPETQTHETAPPVEPTNSDFKNTPAYQAMAKQIAEMKKAEEDRLAAEQSAAQEAQRKELEAKGEYEKLLAMQKQQIEQMQKEHFAEILKRDLKTALIQSGATNDMFIAGAIAGYKEGDISEYVKSLAAAEQNKAFFGSMERQPVPPPGGGPVGGVNTTIKDLASYRKALASGDKKLVAQAIEWGTQYVSSQFNQQ